MTKGEVFDNMKTFLSQLKSFKKGKKERFVNRIWVQIEQGPRVFIDKKEFEF